MYPIAVAPNEPRLLVRIPIIEGRDIRFRKLSNPQNLSHVSVESIVQDAQGFMWFVTWNGLNRYDGYKFRLFKHAAGDPNSLSGVYVYALFKDHSGNQWVGTEGFVDRFDPKSETFTHYRLDQLPATSSTSEPTQVPAKETMTTDAASQASRGGRKRRKGNATAKSKREARRGYTLRLRVPESSVGSLLYLVIAFAEFGLDE